MVRIKIARIFFDRKDMLDRIDAATKRVFSRFGAYTRRTARQSIRKRKKASKPGKPPSSHEGLLKRFIFFGYDRRQRSVVIGPEKLSGPVSDTALEALEYGGRSRTSDYVWTAGRRRKKVFRNVKIDARPFMGPAFEKEKPKLDGLWHNSVTSTLRR